MPERLPAPSTQQLAQPIRPPLPGRRRIRPLLVAAIVGGVVVLGGGITGVRAAMSLSTQDYDIAAKAAVQSSDRLNRLNDRLRLGSSTATSQVAASEAVPALDDYAASRQALADSKALRDPQAKEAYEVFRQKTEQYEASVRGLSVGAPLDAVRDQRPGNELAVLQAYLAAKSKPE